MKIEDFQNFFWKILLFFPSHTKFLFFGLGFFLGENFNIFLKIMLISVQTAKVSKYVCVYHCYAVIGIFQRTVNFSFKNDSKSETHEFRFFEKIRI